MMSRVSPAAALVVSLAAALPYLPTVTDYFIQDDFGVVWLLSGKPWSSFPRWFASTWMDDIWGFTPDEIRPFPAVTYQVAALFGAGSPVANHLMNIAFHAGNGLLVLAIARTVAGLSVACATFAALVFVLLPPQAESVAWVTGRVDSMPAFVYLAAFLLYARWRERGDRRLYWASVACFFVALFSKQNMITLGPALVLYDLVMVRRKVSVSWAWMRPYLPYALLTIGYLALRYALFGEVARERQLSASGLEFFGGLVVRHARRMVFGDVAYGTPFLIAAVVVVLAAVAWAVPRVMLFFGVIWWVLGIAPVIVAAYESPRHIYLASVAWAVVLGQALDLGAAFLPRGRFVRAIFAMAPALVLTLYAFQLQRVVQDWRIRASVSRKAVIDLEREVRAAPQGALIVAAAPVRSWEWALPFVLREPFVRPGVEGRVSIVTPQALYCCRAQWEGVTRDTLRQWLARADRTPVIALRWDARSGGLFRLTEREEPYLRSLLEVIVATDSAFSLERAILNLTDRLPPAK
jgi:hypothetical protein